MAYHKLYKYYHDRRPYAPPDMPRVIGSVDDHFENIIGMYTNSYAYRITLPSYHIGYDYATNILLQMADSYGFSSKHNLLELCCGFGTTMIYLGINYSFTIIGVDIVKAHIDECNRRISRHNFQNRITAVCRNVLDLYGTEYAGTQDIVLCEDSFSHIPDRSWLLHMCRRLLKPGGLLVFSDLVRTRNISQSELDKQCTAWCLYPIESFGSYSRLITTAGFRILDAQDNLGRELIEYHIEVDKKWGDADPEDYFLLFDKNEGNMIKEWGQGAYDIRRERLLVYKYLLSSKLDYAYFIASNY